MTRFDALSKRLAHGPMLREHGEEVAFRGKGKRVRLVKAIVDREPPEPTSSGGPNPARQRAVITVHVPDSFVNGVEAWDIDEENDEIEVAFRKGDTPRWRRIKRMPFEGQYAGWVPIEVS